MKTTKTLNSEMLGKGNLEPRAKNSVITDNTSRDINVSPDNVVFDNYLKTGLYQDKISVLKRNLPEEIQSKGKFGFIRTPVYRDERGCLQVKKIPCNSKGNPINGYASGVSFDEVAHPNTKVNAISFVLPDPGNWYAVIDIDDCIINGHLNLTHPGFDKIDELLKLLDTYFEISMSGHGLHGIIGVDGGKPEFVKRTRNDYFELYFEKRVIALTGNILPGKYSKIQWLNIDEMKQVYDLLGFNPKPSKKEVPSGRQNSIMNRNYELSNAESVEEVLDRLRSRSLSAELIDGDWRNTRYPSKSEADAGLAYYSAVQSRCNKSIMLAVMYQSNLYLDDLNGNKKWDRENYLDNTLESAIREVCKQNPAMAEYLKTRENGE